MSKREDVINAYKQKNKDRAVSNAKSQAADRLRSMSDKDKQVMTVLKQLVDRSSVGKIYEMLQIINLSES